MARNVTAGASLARRLDGLARFRQAWLCALLLAACGDAAPAGEAAPEARPDRPAVATDTQAAVHDAERSTALSDHAGDDVVVFLGTSLTAGYGLDPEQAFPALVQAEIDRAGLPFRVVNAGVSGETSAGGLRRLDSVLREPVAALVLELGANDGLRGLGIPQLRENLTAIIKATRERWPDADIIVAGMEAPPNLGSDYTARFREVFPAIAREQDAILVPFLLEGVAGEASLNLEDRIHPNRAGHEIIARTVWMTLEPMLRRRVAAGVNSHRPDSRGRFP